MGEGRKRLPIPQKAQTAVAIDKDQPLTVGLDLSITGTGIVAITAGGYVSTARKVGSKVVEGMGDIERFSLQVEAVMQVIGPRPVDLFVVENYAFSGNGQITRLAEYAGLVKYTLWSVYGVPEKNITFCSPMTMKKFVTGKGNAEKDQILKAVYQRWGQDFDSNDVADAFGLAIVGHFSRYSHPVFPERLTPITALEIDALKTYRKGNDFFGPVEKKTKKKKVL